MPLSGIVVIFASGMPTQSSSSQLKSPLTQAAVQANPAVGHVTWRQLDTSVVGAVSLDADSARRIGLGIGDSFTMAGRA